MPVLRLISGVFCILITLACASPSVAQESDLWGEATLYRDEWGVPHVQAATPRGLGFAFGYAQAEDHAEPMLLAFRTAMGRLAEVRGESAAESDALALRMGHGQLAEQALPTLDDVTRGICEGFALGVNAWLAENIDDAPDWADGVAPHEVLALWHQFLTSQAPLDLPGAAMPPRGMETGNAWAVAPGQTPEGQTVLVVNPHQFHEGQFLWYEAHLTLDDYNMYGATLYGLPVLLVGHNAVLGWGITPNQADIADVFERPMAAAQQQAANDPGLPEEVGEDALLLQYYSRAKPYYVSTEAGLDERLQPVHLTPDGPIIESGGTLYLWQIAGYGQFGGFRQLLDMGRSANLEQFQQSLQWQQLPSCNVIYGDAYGNIFYLYNTVTGYRQLPDETLVRLGRLTDGQANWKEPLPAVMKNWGWGSYLSITDMPYLVNPEYGFLQACNTAPWTVTDVVPYSPEIWPAWLGNDTDSYRAQRVRQLLRSGMRSFRDNQSMLYDLVAPAGYEMKNLLLAAASAQSEWIETAHPDLKGFLDVLADWDNLAEVRTPGMTAFHLWWAALRARTPGYVTEAQLQDALLANVDGIQQEALSAAAEAARMMRNEFDRLDLPWGDVHRIRRGEREEPLPGALSGEPIFTAGDFTYEQGKWLADYGYGFAMAVQFGEQPQAVSVTPFGSSDVAASPHYDDQLDLMLTRRFKRTRYQPAEVMRNATIARGREITLYPLGVEAAFRFTSDSQLAASLSSQVDTPGFLPEGTTAFGMYVKPRAERPAEAQVRLEVSFYVPLEFCLDADLPLLALHRFDDASTWVRLEDQQWDYERRVLFGTGPVDGVYAVLGPQTAFAAAAPDSPEGEPGPDSFEPPVPAPAPVVSQTNLADLLPPQSGGAEGESTGAEGETASKEEGKPGFKFEWANPPKKEVDFGAATEPRQFKFERLQQPETTADFSPEPPPLKPTQAPTAPDITPVPEGQPAAPDGMPAPDGDAPRTFKFQKGGGAIATEAPSAPKRGKVVFGLPPHVLERQKKQHEQQGQQQPEAAP